MMMKLHYSNGVMSFTIMEFHYNNRIMLHYNNAHVLLMELNYDNKTFMIFELLYDNGITF